MALVFVGFFSAGLGIAVWLLVARVVEGGEAEKIEGNPRPQPPKPQSPQVGLFLECSFQDFPLTIPAGSKMLVLQAHPSIIKKHVGLREIKAPLNENLAWPSDREAIPLPLPLPGRSKMLAGPNFQGLKCTLRKYGDPVSIDKIAIRLTFSTWGKYDLFVDPLESQGTFADFTFYMVNYCYSEPPRPGTYDSGSAEARLVVGTFSQTATLHVVGDSNHREVPITIPFRQSLQPNFILPGTYRRWIGFPPC